MSTLKKHFDNAERISYEITVHIRIIGMQWLIQACITDQFFKNNIVQMCIFQDIKTG